jgi:glycosyltransferase involved in cell wall biosynthesis
VRILVTHPGRQHSHQAALGLDKAGMLAGYWAGVPVAGYGRYAPAALGPGQARSAPWTPALRRAGDRLLPRTAAAWTDFAACRLFDRWAARSLARFRLDAVIACEISSLETFREARRLGIATILDAPSIHHAAQDRLHGTADPPDLHRRITGVKDEEIALADHVLTVSELARQTYLEVGVPPGKVHAIPLGADLDLFAPGEPPEGPFTFLFSGATILRKGFDLLLAAFERVPDARLKIVGSKGDLGHLLDGRSPDRITLVGPVPQRELAEQLRRADCLVLPSRNDSYGMVVAEALASGTPVLVSEMVGSKDLVTEGKTGWIVPVEDVNALADRMLWCATYPEAVRALRPDCRAAAREATWPAYHQRLAELLRRLLP